MSEQDYAVMEASMIAAVDEYMKARPQIDFVSNRRIYEAGFKKAYAQLEQQLTAEREARKKAEDSARLLKVENVLLRERAESAERAAADAVADAQREKDAQICEAFGGFKDGYSCASAIRPKVD